MKLFFIKISSFTLALLVMLSTLSFTIEKHFCHGDLVDIAYFGESTECEDEGEECNLSIIGENNCCEDETEKIEGQNEIRTPSFEDLDFETQKFVASFIISHINLLEGLHNKVIPHRNYLPPNLTLNFQTLYEVFIL